jgi:hypothetical protein
MGPHRRRRTGEVDDAGSGNGARPALRGRRLLEVIAERARLAARDRERLNETEAEGVRAVYPLRPSSGSIGRRALGSDSATTGPEPTSSSLAVAVAFS